MIIYPIKFTPILKQKIWGGDKLVSEFNKKSSLKKIGESWEITGVNGNISVVKNGDLAGCRLTDLIKNYTVDFVGTKVYNEFGNQFPLLFKFIDAKEDLSIQLHPNNELAQKRHNSFGKTEMWYVLNADPGAKIYAGLNKKLNNKSYSEILKKRNITDYICKDEAEAGDAFFINVGTIHAIGKGVLLAEIQQTSDVTYRLYDWDRLDEKGNSRELHTDLVIDAIDFSKIGSCKLNYDNKVNFENEITSCEYFTTNKLNLTNYFDRDLSNIDSFVVYMCVEGSCEITLNSYTEPLNKGETILIPSLANRIEFKNSLKVELLEVYIK